MNYLHLLKLFSISIGGGGGSVGGIFSLQKALIKITIEDLIKEDLFDGEEDDDWKILQKKLSKNKEEDIKNLKLTSLEEIKSKGEEDSGDKLKEWCQTKRTISFKKYLPSRMENLLLHHLKLFCIMKIGEKLEEENQFTNYKEDKNEINKKIKELEKHSENDEEKGDISKEKELEEIKTKGEREKERALYNWCKEIYKKIYRKDRDENLWKLTNYYCKKSEIQKAVES